MSLLARSIATLEGIALLGDPNYQMVAQAYPFVVRKVLRNSTASVGTLLRDIVFDASTGAVKPTRLSALLNAALGFVAERTDGFVDLDAVPEEGASLQVRKENEREKMCDFGQGLHFSTLFDIFPALFLLLFARSSSPSCVFHAARVPYREKIEQAYDRKRRSLIFWIIFPSFPFFHPSGRRLVPPIARGEGPAPSARRGARQRARLVGEGRPPEGLRDFACFGSSSALHWLSSHAPAAASARTWSGARQFEGPRRPLGSRARPPGGNLPAGGDAACAGVTRRWRRRPFRFRFGLGAQQ